MQRRDLVLLGGMAALAASSAGLAQDSNRPVADPDAKLTFTRIHTVSGESRIDQVEVSPHAKMIPVVGLIVNAYKPTKVDWHNVKQPQFTINMTGDLEVEVTSGARRKIGPGDLVFLEDVTGKGHITRLSSPVTNLFIRVAPGFDVLAWAKGA